MFLINGQNIEELGLYFKKGTIYQELLKLAKPKPRFFNDWPDQNGKDYDDISETRYETVTYNPTMILVASNIPDLMDKRDTLQGIFDAKEGFTLTSITLGRDYHLRYIDSPSFRTINPIWSNGKIYCEFTVLLENNHQQADEYGILFDVFDNAILDGDGNYIIVKANRNE